MKLISLVVLAKGYLMFNTVVLCTTNFIDLDSLGISERKPLWVLKRGFGGQTPAQQVAYFLNWIFEKDLNGFVDEKHFMFQKFRPEITRLTDAISQCEIFVKTRNVQESKVMKTLFFVQNIFQIMVEATNVMENNTSTKTDHFSLLNEMYELNVRCLMLKTSDGSPNFIIAGFRTILHDIFCSFYSVNSLYQVFDGVSLDNIFRYAKVANEVESCLEDLKKNISNPKSQQDCFVTSG